jgi:hypothetical protein
MVGVVLAKSVWLMKLVFFLRFPFGYLLSALLTALSLMRSIAQFTSVRRAGAGAAVM